MRDTLCATVKQGLNAPGLTEFVSSVYINTHDELIVKVNNKWVLLSSAEKEEIKSLLEYSLLEYEDVLDLVGLAAIVDSDGKQLDLVMTPKALNS